jgi:hypothetical protein
MNKLTETIFDRIMDWPEQAQAELVESIAEIQKKHVGAYQLSDDERAAVLRGLEEMRQGKIASDEQVEAVFSRYR